MLLSLILIFGAWLRFTNVNWDKGQHLHPDERFLSIISSRIQLPSSVSEYFDTDRSRLNPYNQSDTFVYGTFPLFLNKTIAEWLDRDEDGTTHWTADVFRDVARPLGLGLEREDGSLTFNGGYDSNRIGRVLSGVADLLTIVLVFELGRIVYGKGAGLLAATLLSVAALHIQYSHFFGSETFLALFATATVYFAVRIYKYGGAWNYAGAGLAFGLALASKLSAAPVAGIVGLAIFLRLLPVLRAELDSWFAAPSDARDHDRLKFRDLQPYLAGGILFAGIALLTFRIFQPYAFNGPTFFDVFAISLDVPGDILSPAVLDPRNYLDLSPKFVHDIENLARLQDGADTPPNLQWLDRTWLVFPLRNIVLWGLGLPLAVAALGSLVYAGYRGLSKGDMLSLLLVVWVVGYFLFAGRGFVPSMRYFIPIYPALAVLAGYGLTQLWQFGARGFAGYPAWLRRPGWRPVAQGAVALLVLGAVLWGLAFTGVYRHDISRVQASVWISENVPDGSTLSYQEWDDGLPLSLEGVKQPVFEHVKLTPFVPNSPEQVEEFVAQLDQIDFVVESSNRLYGTIPRYPARYPSTTLYYKYLFDGTLGFEKVGDFTNYPTLFGIDIPDQSSEEAFTVYDHPRVVIFQKTDAYSSERALELLRPEKSLEIVNLPPGEASENGLFLQPGDLATQREGGTWTDVFSDSGIVASNPAIVWFVALQAAAFAVTPIALTLFRRLPDRGYLLAKPLGLLLLAYLTWLSVSLKLVHFEQTTILGILLLLAVVGAGALYWKRAEVFAFLRENWRLVLFSELLFLAAFLFFYGLRLENPDLWHASRGGEKPMDLGYLTAVARSTTLPPYDPWFAGGYINYYYMGQFFTATLAKLTTIPPEVAFNLAVPTYFSLTVAAAFSVAYNLAASSRRLLAGTAGRRIAAESRLVRVRNIPRWSPYAAGLLGAFLVAVAGNLDGVGQLVERLSAVSSFQADTNLPLVDSVANSLGGLWQVVFHGANLQDFDYWRSSRMMPPTISITEFPYFSFLFADLHAHMMAIAFQVLTIGVCLTLCLSRRGERDGWRDTGLVVLLGLIVGSLRWLNSWDYPPFLLLSLSAVLISERHMEGGIWSASKRAILKCALLGALSFVLFQPFLDNYRTPVAGITSSPEQTPVHQYLAHFGLFAAVIGAGLLVWLSRQLRGGFRTPQFAYESETAEFRLDVQVGAIVFFGLIGLAVLLALGLILYGQPLVAVLLPVFAIVAALALREVVAQRADSGIRLFVLSLIGLGLGLSMGVDVIILEGDISRMNTVFKFYLHIWVLFALAASFFIWQFLFVYWRPALVLERPRLPRFAAAGAVATVAALLLAVTLYPVFATPVRLDDRFDNSASTGLDGMAYMETAVYEDEHGDIELADDLEGIRWIRENVEGTPTIVEAGAALYRWNGRFSVYTGLPSVVGWDWHQRQQRGDLAPLVTKRGNDLTTFYNDTDVDFAKTFLAQHDVRYVIVGTVERYYYGERGMAKFEAGLDGALEPVFENETLTIYRVLPERLTDLVIQRDR